MSDEDRLSQSRAALLDGRYLEALHLAEEIYASGRQKDAAALVRARAADLGGLSRRRTEQFYLVALSEASNKPPVLGHLALFYLQTGQTRKARETNAAFAESCRYNCTSFAAQYNSARKSQ